MNLRFHIILSLILVLSSLSITSCHSPGRTQYEPSIGYWYNRPFTLPDYAHFYGSIDSALLFDSPYKVVTYIDGNCGSCMNTLFLWNNFLDSLNGFDSVNLVIYVNTYYPELVETFFLENLSSDLPFLHDLDDQFIELNNDLVNDNIYTVLLDEKNSIILIGDPISSDDIMQGYLDSIRSFHRKTQ